MTMTLHDWTASIIAVALVLGILGLVAIGRDVPTYLVNALFAALSWATRGAVNSYNNRRRNP